jgi:hypothetical protein
MCCMRFPISASYRKAVERPLQTAQHLGQWPQVKSRLAILALREGQRFAQLALVVRVHEKTRATWVGVCCCDGVQGAPHPKPTGRPPTLPPTQQAARALVLDEGPGKAGGRGACWRSPMIQPCIDDRCGGFSHVFSRAQSLTNLGLRFQPAAVGSDPLTAEKRTAWRPTTGPQMRRVAPAQHALLLFGAAASFPQGGPLPSPWARRGPQAKVQTAGKRTGYTGFGLLAACTGGFFPQGQAGRLHATAALAFRTRGLTQTTRDSLLRQAGAKSHTSAEPQACFTQPAARLQVVPRPTYAPDYNPIAKLCKKSKQQETPLHSFPTCEALTDKVEQALLQVATIPAEILALCSLPTDWAQAA